MRKLAVIAVVVLAPLLGASQCQEPHIVLPPDTPIPPLPYEIRQCAKLAGVEIPPGALTAGQVAKLWPQDRLTIEKLRRCLNRSIAIHDDIRAKWR